MMLTLNSTHSTRGNRGVSFLFFTLSLGASLLILPQGALAQDVTLPLVPCGGIDCDLCDLYELARRIINFLLFQLSLPIAVIAFIAGGVLWLTSGGSEQRISQGKTILWYAVIGMLLAFAAWVIVNTILDTLVFRYPTYGTEWFNTSFCSEFEKLITATKTEDGTGNGDGDGEDEEETQRGYCVHATDSSLFNCLESPCSDCAEGYLCSTKPADCSGTLDLGTDPDLVLSNDEAAAVLDAEGIDITSTGSCSDINVATCTSLEGIPENAVDELILINNSVIANQGSTDLEVTGGTEVGHATHGPGKSIVDLDDNPQTNAYIQGRIGTSGPSLNTWYSDKDTELTRYYFYEGDHWHVCLNTTDCPEAVGVD